MNTNIATEIQKLTNTALPIMEKLDAAKSLEKQIRKQIVELAAERKQEIKEASDLEKRIAAAVEHAFATSEPQKYKGNSHTLSAARNWLAKFTKAKKKPNIHQGVQQLFEREKPVSLTRSRGWLHEEERIKIAFYAQNLPKVTTRTNCVLHFTHIATKFNCSVMTVRNYAKYSA